eukprot:TRINITY_DN7590_c0_g1_i1.p1 TRINITY_DN7590_c0_g1~~TRINITY_DN7590_c0_g1_i1.p1  ORF type:complete len:243 (+),score=-12.68 TRINITY_DN7590_c0_g1_i1:174-902(+)
MQLICFSKFTLFYFFRKKALFVNINKFVIFVGRWEIEYFFKTGYRYSIKQKYYLERFGKLVLAIANLHPVHKIYYLDVKNQITTQKMYVQLKQFIIWVQGTSGQKPYNAYNLVCVYDLCDKFFSCKSGRFFICLNYRIMLQVSENQLVIKKGWFQQHDKQTRQVAYRVLFHDLQTDKVLPFSGRQYAFVITFQFHGLTRQGHNRKCLSFYQFCREIFIVPLTARQAWELSGLLCTVDFGSQM